MSKCKREMGEMGKMNIITKKEYDLIVNQLTSVVDKTMFSLLFYEFLRVNEMMNLKMKSFEDCGNYGFLFIEAISPRKIVVINSLELIRELIKTHIDKNNPNAYLFTSYSNRNKLSHRYLRRILNKINEIRGKNNLNKISLHSFRYSGIKYAYKELLLSEEEICTKTGWSKDTMMLKHYIDKSKT